MCKFNQKGVNSVPERHFPIPLMLQLQSISALSVDAPGEFSETILKHPAFHRIPTTLLQSTWSV